MDGDDRYMELKSSDERIKHSPKFNVQHFSLQIIEANHSRDIVLIIIASTFILFPHLSCLLNFKLIVTNR